MGLENSLYSHQQALEPVRKYGQLVRRRQFLGVFTMLGIATGLSVLARRKEEITHEVSLAQLVANFETDIVTPGKSIYVLRKTLFVNTLSATDFPEFEKGDSSSGIYKGVIIDPFVFFSRLNNNVFLHSVYFHPETNNCMYSLLDKIPYVSDDQLRQDIAIRKIASARVISREDYVDRNSGSQKFAVLCKEEKRDVFIAGRIFS